MSYVWRTFRRCLPCFVVQGARQWGWRYCAIQCHACRIAWASQFTRCRGFSNNELSIGYGKSCAGKVPMCKKMCLVKILWMMWLIYVNVVCNVTGLSLSYYCRQFLVNPNNKLLNGHWKRRRGCSKKQASCSPLSAIPTNLWFLRWGLVMAPNEKTLWGPCLFEEEALKKSNLKCW